MGEKEVPSVEEQPRAVTLPVVQQRKLLWRKRRNLKRVRLWLEAACLAMIHRMTVRVDRRGQDGYFVFEASRSLTLSITAMDDASKSSHIVMDIETLCDFQRPCHYTFKHVP